MVRHVTSLAAAADLPSGYGLPEGASIVKGGVTWYIKGGSWEMGGGGGIDWPYDASKSYAPGQACFMGGDLWVARSSTYPGPFDKGYWERASSVFNAKGVWDTSDPDDMPYAYAGDVYQFDGKLWRCISPEVSTEQEPSTTAVELTRAAYVQVGGYGGTAGIHDGAYVAIELIIEDLTGNSDALIHKATGINLWRSYPVGDDWEPTDVYRLVTKADFDAAQAAHDSLLDIPTVTTLTLAYASNGVDSGDRSARLSFAAPVDLAPSTNPGGPDYVGSGTKDRYVLISDRQDIANFTVDPSAFRAGLDFGWYMVYLSDESTDVSSSTGAFPSLDVVATVPAWQLVFDPSL